MTRVVVALEGMGLVSRTPHPTDGRQVVIALTDAATALLDDEARAREAWLTGQLQQLSPAEREVLREAAVLVDKLASG
jgi:DNA-binding MarR family transcriptional regulator